MPPKIEVFICPTTHWDREWVMTFGQFQARLVRLMDKVLKLLDTYPQYKFYLDGQAAVLDDYLEIKPENSALLSEHLARGRLKAGPWYILADQFLESGEATIRNLMLGRWTIEGLRGQPEKVGYVPDSFGSAAGLPMILRGFGIDAAMFGRGRPRWSDDLNRFEFTWKAADGQEALAINHGYGNGLFLSYRDIWADIFDEPHSRPDLGEAMARFMEQADRQRKTAAVPDILYFSVGADHMEPHAQLVDVVDHINASQDVYRLKFATPGEYALAVRKAAGALQSYTGELYGSDAQRLFEGTLTSRVRLKQLNDRCDLLLAAELEPLHAMLAARGLLEYPGGHLRSLWKRHIQNHAHDSICGCGLDAVAREIEGRCGHILATGEYLRKDALHALTAAIDTSGGPDGAAPLVVVNPLGHARRGHARALARVPFRMEGETFALRDDRGNPVPAIIRKVAEKNKDLESVYMTGEMLARVISKDAPPEKDGRRVFTALDVDFVADAVPSMGYRTWWITPAPRRDDAPAVMARGDTAENEFLVAAFRPNGTFDLTDKRSGHIFRGLGWLADREDTGNSYEHFEFPVPDERTTLDARAPWKKTVHEAHLASHETAFTAHWPERLLDGRRSDANRPVGIKIKATLYAGLEYLEVAVTVDNTCRDHSLRAVFDTGIETDASRAYGHFTLLSRPLSPGTTPWRSYPFEDFVCVTGKAAGEKQGGPAKSLAVATRGLPAYEAIRGEGGVRLCLDLLRATGTIGQPAGANYPAPEAQCQGQHTFEYALFANNDGDDANYLRKASDWRRGLLAESAAPGPGSAALRPSDTFLVIEADGVPPHITCLKMADSGGGYVCRLWNPGPERTVRLTGLLAAGPMWRCGLDDHPIEPVSPDAVALPARGIASLKLSAG